MNETRDKVRSGIDHAADRAKMVTESAGNTVAGMAGEAKDKVQEWSSDAVDVAKQAGDKVQKWAGEAYDTTSDTMKDFGKEMTTMVKKYPIQSVLVGFGVGLLLGRAARS